METITDIRRNQLEIFIDILKFTSEPRRPTHIMHRTNLNHLQLKRYLSWLVTRNLLREFLKPRHTFQITKKGENFIELTNVDNSKCTEFPTSSPNGTGGLK